MDPQANCSSGLGIEPGSYKKSVYDVIIGKKIPAGTGLVHAADTIVGSQLEYDRLANMNEKEIDPEDVLEEVKNSVEK